MKCLHNKGMLSKGFTLIEVLAALTIISVFVAPLTLMFYKSHVNQRAYQKYYANQLLKKELNRAVVEKRIRKKTIKVSPVYQVVIEVEQQRGEILYQGRVYHKQKGLFTSFQVSRYEW